MNPDSRGLIGLRTAILIYALLAVFAALTLKGNARLIVLLVVVLLALKTYVHHIRRRLE